MFDNGHGLNLCAKPGHSNVGSNVLGLGILRHSGGMSVIIYTKWIFSSPYYA